MLGHCGMGGTTLCRTSSVEGGQVMDNTLHLNVWMLVLQRVLECWWCGEWWFPWLPCVFDPYECRWRWWGYQTPHRAYLEVLSRIWKNVFFVMRGLVLVTLPMAWTLYASTSCMVACARIITILLGYVPSMLAQCMMKSTQCPWVYLDLWNHYVYIAVLRHCIWHHPTCLLICGGGGGGGDAEVTPITLCTPKSCLMALSLRDNRLFYTCFYDVVEKWGKLCV